MRFSLNAQKGFEMVKGSLTVVVFSICAITCAQSGPVAGANGKSSMTGGAAESGPAVNDYIACVFTPDQLAAFRLKPPMTVLNAERAEKTIEAATGTVNSLIEKKILKKDEGVKLAENLRSKSLVGMDAKEAQHSILTTLGESLATVPAAAKEATADAIKERTNATLETSFSAPTDVACSISPLTYNEIDHIFGRSIAKNYVAFQVVARNLNSEKEFQLHSVELAVDTDPCGTKEQFDAGRDRLLVRAMAYRNQSTDPRNFTIRIMEGISSIAGSAVGFASADYAKGLAVFSALTPAGKSIFPDYTVDQLNRISDLTFSSAGQTRTVVPKNGVAMFMTFIPSKPLEQSWWVEKATQVPGGGWGTPICTNAMGNPKQVRYKDWSSDALLEFRRHTSVIVAGVHTTAEDALIPAIDTVDCQNGAKVLDLGANSPKNAAPSEVTCNLKGKNLEQVVILELQNAKSALDTVGATAPVTVRQGDSTTATAVFKGDDLRALNGTTYNVLWTNGHKLSKATEKVVKIHPYPIVTSIDTNQLQLPVTAPGTLVIKGNHLKMTDVDGGIKPVNEIKLTSQLTKAIIALKVDSLSVNTDTQLSVPYTAADFKDKPAEKYAVTVLVDGKVVEGASDSFLELLPAPTPTSSAAKTPQTPPPPTLPPPAAPR